MDVDRLRHEFKCGPDQCVVLVRNDRKTMSVACVSTLQVVMPGAASSSNRESATSKASSPFVVVKWSSARSEDASPRLSDEAPAEKPTPLVRSDAGHAIAGSLSVPSEVVAPGFSR